MNASASLVQVEVAGVKYNHRTEPRCRVCQHSLRSLVERLTAEGRTWKAIIRMLPPDSELAEHHLYEHHRRGHCPAPAPAVRRVAEERGAALSEDAKAQVEHVAHHLRLAHQVVERAAARLAAGEVDADLRDGLAAAKFIADTEGVAAAQMGAQQFVEAFQVLLEVTKSLLSPEDFIKVNAEFRARRRASTAKR